MCLVYFLKKLYYTAPSVWVSSLRRRLKRAICGLLSVDFLSQRPTPRPPFFLDTRRQSIRWLYEKGIILNASLREWQRLHNKYRGQNGFVIGNGPSLTMEDLDRIAGKPSIGSNKIYLAYEQTYFRPTMLTCVDQIVAESMVEDLRNISGNKYFSHLLVPFIEPMPGAIYWMDISGATKDPNLLRKFSFDASNGLYSGHTVTYNNLQLAYHLGFKTVYLIGMDFRFLLPEQKEMYTDIPVLISDRERNHFHPNYRKRGERWTVPKLDLQRIAFQAARLHFENNRRKIINATRGGDLDVFERLDLDEVVEKWDD